LDVLKNKNITCLNLKIQELAEVDRPREKLLQKGPSALSEAELLAILLRSGTKDLSAIGLAQAILKYHDNSLNELSKSSPQDLQRFKGIGVAKAVAIASALELGRRKNYEVVEKPKIHCSKDLYTLMKVELMGKLVEEFWVVLLTRSHFVIRKILVSKGGTAQLAVDPKVVFKQALEYHAASIVLVHNHPSNNPQPSEVDILLTERLVKGGKILDLPILDHLIFTDRTYFSFTDEHLVI